MTAAREIMTPDATLCPEDTTAADAARQMADDGFGALPVCDTDGRLDSFEEAIRPMKDHAVRRLPVIDGTALVGMVSQADIARAMPDAKIGDLVDVISSAPPNG
jgi:CBS domain-containing protein